MVAGSRIHLVGTIPGFVPDAGRVQAAIHSFAPSVIAVGVPAEDLDALALIIADPHMVEDLEPDDLDAHLLQLLERFGPTHVLPSPDLETAHQSGVPIEAVDMDDHQHTERYTSLVKLHHLVQRGSVRKRLHKQTFDTAADPYALVQEWDAQLLTVKPLAAIEAERETHMAQGIRALTAAHPCVLGILHAARLPGVARRLRDVRDE